MLPPEKRKPVRIAWLFRLMAWYRKIYAEFLVLQESLDAESKVTGQVIVLESHLADVFGGEITITHNDIRAEGAFVSSSDDADGGFAVVEDSEESFGGVFIQEGTEDTSYNFNVSVPAALAVDTDRLRAIINKYKITGSTYEIVTI